MKKGFMTGLITIAALLFLIFPAFAAETGHQVNVPVFTNEDLERYGGKPMAERPPEVAEKGLPQKEREVDAGTLLRENEGIVAAVGSYDSEGVLFIHGSGFFVRGDGVVVTSLHVIRNAAEIRVKAGGRVFTAKGLLFADEENDVALLKVEGTGFPAVALGDIGSSGEGEKVYVMGNPQAERNTVSEGTFVGVKELGNRRSVLQITAPFSEGMSGGPVFNKNGEVIGIAAFVLREAVAAQGPQGIYFAVPANVIRSALTMEKVTDLKDIPKVEPKRTAEYWLDFAHSLSKSGRYQEAVDAYRKSVEIDPGLATAFNGLGVAFLRLRKYSEAIDAFRKALATDPDSAWTYSNLGLAYMESGMEKEAIDALTRAVKIMPDLGPAHFNLGLTYRRMGMYREAAEAYRNAVRANPGSAEAHFHLGVMYVNLHENNAAMEEYRILRDLNPTLADRLSSMMKQ